MEPGGELAPAGFALYRAVAGEAGLLTLSVLSEARRRRLETNAGRLHRRSVALAVGKPWE